MEASHGWGVKALSLSHGILRFPCLHCCRGHGPNAWWRVLLGVNIFEEYMYTCWSPIDRSVKIAIFWPFFPCPQEDQEWKEFEEETEKDYTGLRIQNLQIRYTRLTLAHSTFLSALYSKKGYLPSTPGEEPGPWLPLLFSHPEFPSIGLLMRARRPL